MQETSAATGTQNRRALRHPGSRAIAIRLLTRRGVERRGVTRRRLFADRRRVCWPPSRFENINVARG